MLNNDDGFPIEILESIGSYLEFDAEGKIDRRDLAIIAFEGMDTREAVRKSRSVPGAVVDLGPSIERQQWERQNRWELSKEDLDMIAADIWGTLQEGTKLKNAKGIAPRPPLLTYRAKHVLQDIDDKIALIDFQLSHLSEPALKAIAFRARQRARAGRDEVVWNGVASLANFYCDVQARHRRGNGKWFAVIEVRHSFPGEEAGRPECAAFKECNSKDEAEEAARALLADNANLFSRSMSIEPKLYCDLEWSPEDADVYVWPAARPQTDPEETIDDEEI
jgi:hypothetical protein